MDSFKINLGLYKNRTLALADQYHRVSTGHFWGVSIGACPQSTVFQKCQKAEPTKTHFSGDISF